MANTTWNTADRSNVTLSGGNLIATATGAGYVRTVAKATSGKYYWEVRPTTWANGNTGHGFCPSALSSPSGASAAGMLAIYNSGNIYVNGNATGASLTGVSGNSLGFALDFTGKLAWLRVTPSGNWNGSGTANPATGTGGINVTSITSVDACPLAAFGGSAEVVTANFGDSAFVGTVPSGFTSGFLGGAPPPTARQNAVTVISG